MRGSSRESVHPSGVHPHGGWWRACVGAAVLLLAGCSHASSTSTPGASPTPPAKFLFGSTSPTASPASNPPPGSTSSPTGSPGTKPKGSYNSPAPGYQGSAAEVRISGDGIDSTLSFSTVTSYPIYHPPKGTGDITWVDPAGDGLVIGVDQLFVGAKRTSNHVGLQLSIVAPPTVFVSGNGSCTITVTTAAAHLFAGSFTCHGLGSSNHVTVNASGTFRAVVR